MHRSTSSLRRSFPASSSAGAAPVATALEDRPVEAPPAAERAPEFKPASPRATVRRRPQRGSYDPETVFAILDAGLVAHVGFVHEDHPFVIPMAYVRVDRELMLHGSAASRMLEVGAGGAAMTACVTILDGMVYARSAFHHSVNYRSVVVLGCAREIVDDAAKRAFFDALVDRFGPGRARTVRPPTAKELAATRVLALPIEEASAKIRAGGPIDDPEDMTVPVWTGQLPVGIRAMSHIPTPDDAPRFPLPERPRGID
jgi:nitroimidazol reductase NimA-like FMN-containing flavoprotein (pyridoxamine 5'-phosphate oxidase superfamily)